MYLAREVVGFKRLTSHSVALSYFVPIKKEKRKKKKKRNRAFVCENQQSRFLTRSDKSACTVTEAG